MPPPRGARPTAAPLLTFPPIPPLSMPRPPSSSPYTIRLPRRNPFVTALLALPLVFVFALLLFPWWAYLLSLVINYLLVERQQRFKVLCYAAVFIWLDSFAAWSVAMACLRGGGRVGAELGRPALIQGDDEEESVGLLKSHGVDDVGESGDQDRHSAVAVSAPVQVKSDGRPRNCRKCGVWKPDRAHHCSSCGHCVLKMDHHCPWLFTCVGWANYKFFLLFLWYSAATGAFVAATTMYELVNFVDAGPNNYELAPMAWALVFFEGIIFGFSVGTFGLYHLYLACKNRTTIESMERPFTVLPSSAALPPSSAAENGHEPLNFRPDHALSRRERWDLERATKKLSIYDRGSAGRNLATVFGGWDKRWQWAVPVGWPPGDGTTHAVDHEKLHKLRQVTAEIRLGRRTRYEDDSAERFGQERVRRA